MLQMLFLILSHNTMMKKPEKNIKAFYNQYYDNIRDKRANSPYVLRRYVHATQYEGILQYVQPGMKVLDAGCGDGVLSVQMANKGAIVTGCDFSEPNIAAAKKYVSQQKIANVEFLVGDAENLPFSDNSFDLVVSSHVLEHLPDFDKGLREIMRVTKKRAIIAIPTVLNLCSFVQVGRGWFWLKGPRSFFALIRGFFLTCKALFLREEGVDEMYGGAKVPHIFRFPLVMKKKVKRLGFDLVSYHADCLCLPYFESALPIMRYLDRFRDKMFLRDLGYGTTFVIEK
ncbi:MAG: hypothetical protein B7X03_03670 [Parcubacteria group bacterium 21-58-10]|nr:MAG: hypothetical protein B7X03_03670 [Parcubacteria group bacterium 21-58-10]